MTSIGAAAFRGCDNLTELIIPDGISSIGEGAFLECSGLTHITLPKNISFLGYETFQECSSLVSITFSNKILLIQNAVFFRCTSLTDVYYSGSESEWSGITTEDYNDPLLAATIHYNSTGPAAIDSDSLGEGILYVPYSGTIGLVNADEAEQPAFFIIGGTLPKGLSLDPDTGEISGTPREAGSFKITVEVSGARVSLRGELKRTSQNYTVDVKGPDKKPDPEEDEDTDSSLSSGSGGGSSSGTGKSGSGSSGGGAAPYTNESWVKDEIGCFVSESVMMWTVIGNCSILTFKCWTDGQIDSIIGICEGEGRDKQEGRHYNHA
ncbi:MAG: leucine-rich repeat protein [Hungatella sp.]|nr:leucine-rich repeat protein [Hungatella sp.]